MTSDGDEGDSEQEEDPVDESEAEDNSSESLSYNNSQLKDFEQLRVNGL